jgi:hypothetical protein
MIVVIIDPFPDPRQYIALLKQEKSASLSDGEGFFSRNTI